MMESSFLLVTNLPNQLFDCEDTKELLETIFRQLDGDIQFEYFRSFSRVRLRCSSPAIAEHVRSKMNGTILMGTTIKVSIAKPAVQLGSRTLGLPAATKQFLISPPTSPPIGWEQTSEQPPVINYDLLSAVYSLAEPSETYKVHQGCVATPTIVVSTPGVENRYEEQNDEVALVRKLSPNIVNIVNTPRPPL